MTEIVKTQLDAIKQSNLSKSKSTASLINFGQKLAEAADTNKKLKHLLQTIQNNAIQKKMETQQQGQKSCTQTQIRRSKKKQAKLFAEIEQLTNNLNFLINQNHKWKLQVDSSRNSRVIYSNVYKTLEKEIRKNEYFYKMAIIEGLTFEEIEVRVKERVKKAVKKLEKEINQLQGVDSIRKKDKLKSRLDTGLQSFRGAKVTSKQTNRFSSKEDVTYKVLQTKRDGICETSKVLSRKTSVLKARPQVQRPIEGLKSQKSFRTRNKIQQAEEINEYFNLQLRSNYYDNVAMQLTKICGEISLKQIVKCWENVQNDIQAEYKDYTEAEENIKKIETQIADQRMCNILPTKKQIGQKSDQQKELQEIDFLIKQQQSKVSELQGALSTKMDFNCGKLNNQEISHHILRMKNWKEVSSRQLEKLLQSACKEKNVSLICSRLLQNCK